MNFNVSFGVMLNMEFLVQTFCGSFWGILATPQREGTCHFAHPRLPFSFWAPRGGQRTGISVRMPVFRRTMLHKSASQDSFRPGLIPGLSTHCSVTCLWNAIRCACMPSEDGEILQFSVLYLHFTTFETATEMKGKGQSKFPPPPTFVEIPDNGSQFKEVTYSFLYPIQLLLRCEEWGRQETVTPDEVFRE